MADIHYHIQFHSPWHCGSGLSAGADLDALVVKDKEGLPFIPGKTIKGLLREAVEDYVGFSGECDEATVMQCFGRMGADRPDDMRTGEAFFTNAQLEPKERESIIAYHLQKFLYRAKASTKIDEDGITDDHTLRRIEVVVPCTLEGDIIGVDEKMVPIISKAMGLVKRMGLNRNRGLGRCTFTTK